MTLPKARSWLPVLVVVAFAVVLRHLLLPPIVNAFYPEASQPQARSWWSRLAFATHTTRPGGWIVPRSRLLPRSRHSHDLRAVSVTPSYSFELVFPQLGNGRVAGTGNSIRTLLTAANFSNQPARCRLSFFDDIGAPLAVPLNGAAAPSLEFELEGGQRKEFESSGEGEVLVGWALLQSDQPVSGQVVFDLRDVGGGLLTEVGVPPADPGSDFTILADSLGETLTGIALANPSSDPLPVTADLLGADGVAIASTEIDLEARGHQAVFLTQLFEEIEGIQEFLGSIRLRAPAAFSAMTLRSTGDLLTSLPTVAPPPDNSDRTRLAFPHVADGVQDRLSISTVLALFNNTETPSRVTLDFFRSDSVPMSVQINGVTASSFDFELQARGVLKVETQGEGALQAGWARARMDQPLSGSAIFRIFSSSGAAALEPSGGVARTLETEVGVDSSLLYRDFRVLADVRGGLNTGLAVANVDPDESDASTSLSIDLRSAEGELVNRTQMEVPAGQHRALFLDQLFPGRDFDNFTGFLRVLKTVGPNVAVVALRSSGAKLTSTPTLTPANGFAPLIETAPFQSLAGTRPGFSWMLHQNQDDLALRELTIRLPGISLSGETNLEPGDEIGVGYFAELPESRIFSLAVTGTDPDSVDFEMVVPDLDGALTGGHGRLLGNGEGLEIRWSLTDPQPFSRTVTDVDHHFFLFPGLLEAPAEAFTVDVETELESVSASPTTERSAVRVVAQSLQFVEASAMAGTIERVTPLFVVPGAPVQFAGRNLGDAPTIAFPLQNGESERVPAYRNVNGVLEAQVPRGVAEGLIFADNGAGPGNGHRIFTLFSPVAEFFRIPGDNAAPLGAVENSELLIRIRRPARQLAFSRFIVRLSGGELDFGRLAPGLSVGFGTVREDPFTTIELAMQVGVVEEDRATIDVLQGATKVAELVLSQIGFPDQPLLEFDYQPVSVVQTTVIAGAFSPLDLEFRLTGLPLTLPTDNLVPAGFQLLSCPTLTGLAESAQLVTQFNLLLTQEGTP